MLKPALALAVFDVRYHMKSTVHTPTTPCLPVAIVDAVMLVRLMYIPASQNTDESSFM